MHQQENLFPLQPNEIVVPSSKSIPHPGMFRRFVGYALPRCSGEPLHVNPRLVILKNALANIIRGMAAAIVAVVLPQFLTRTLSAEAYGAWALVLQFSACVGYFDFGLQTAVARFVAHSTESKDWNKRNSVASTASVMLGIAALLAMIAIFVSVFALPYVFQNVTPTVYVQMRIALLLVTGSIAIGLPISVLHGIFVGLQRAEFSAIVISGSRLASALAIVLAAMHGYGLSTLGLITAGANLGAYAASYALYRGKVTDIQIKFRLFSLRVGKELLSYCYSLTMWSISMLLISGLDLTLVGIFDYSAVPYYAVASGLVIFLAGLQNAVFSALMPAAAALDARGDRVSLGRMLVSSTRYSTFLLLLTGIPLMLYGRSFLNLWVGPVYAEHAIWLLRTLVLANIIRLTVTPYAVILIGTGQQRLVTVSPLVEGTINLVASLIGAKLFGAIGVAVGTLIGAVFCVMANYLYNMPRTTSVRFRFLEYFRDGIVIPGGCVLAMTISLLFLKQGQITPLVSIVMIGATGCLIWRIGLLDQERKFCKKALSL
jgi:O-antigen/teichoic acid export membrane protein